MRGPRNHSRADDERDLMILHELDHQKLGPDLVSRRHGLTRGQIAGLRNRSTGAKAVADHPCLCQRPENMDGGMLPLWWK